MKHDLVTTAPPAVAPPGVRRGALLQAKLRVGAVDDPLEAEADRISEQLLAAPSPAPVQVQRFAGPGQGAGVAPESVERVLAGSGSALESGVRRDMEHRFCHDFTQVRVHADADAARSAREVNARAYTVGKQVVFGAGQFAPATQEGRRLLAHELTHVVQQSPVLRAAPSKGETMVAQGMSWIEDDTFIKDQRDVLKVALKEIAKGKSVSFNKGAGLKRIDAAGARIGLAKKTIDALKADWEWLADNHKSSSKKDYKAKAKALLEKLESPLSAVQDATPKSQAKYWLKNTPTQVADLLYQVADATLPVEQLYVYAAREGLIDYVRDQLKVGAKKDPTAAELKSFKTDKSVSGFNYLGADDFMTELDAKREPLRATLPKAVDLTKVTESQHENEKGRTVRSADFPDLLMALFGFAAVVKRRRSLFLKDAKKHGYAAPSTEELVYWTYVYFNAGEFGGEAQLAKYKDKRKLSDWITKGEFNNSIIVLESYRMLKSMDSKKKMF